jgi:hypothetical protein
MSEVQKYNGGRPPIEITDEILSKVETLAAQGLTKEQIASCLGMGIRTFYEKQKTFPQFLQAMEDGRAKGVATISNSLFSTARDGHFPAQRYYLQNRAPESWKDSSDIVHKGDVKITHEVIAVSEIDRWVGNSVEEQKVPDSPKALSN